MTDTQKHETFGYELAEKGKLWFFGHVFDDFESYIKAYWNKTQSEECDDSYDESFRIDYIEKQFEDDFDVEDDRRLELENDGDADAFYYDKEHVNAFTIKHYRENKDAVMKDVRDGSLGNGGGLIWDWGISDDPGEMTIETLAQWTWKYYTRPYYSQMIKENFSADLGVPLDEIQKEHISVNG